jgi:hypothetical protein
MDTVTTYRGGNGSGTGPGTSLADLMGQYQTATNQANAANSKRYKQGLGKLQGAYDLVNQTGATQVNDINRRATEQSAKAQQSLISRGLGNSTVVHTIQAGIDREANNARIAAGESKNRQLADISGQQAGFIERRNDTPPDTGLLTNLIQNASANQQMQQQQNPIIRVQRGSINDPIQFSNGVSVGGGGMSLGGMFS